MILVIDNYDSFTWNLVQAMSVLRPDDEIRVLRNDEVDVAGVQALAPSHIVLSPGPCTPRESGVCRDIVPAFRGEIPLLGVCLGHQTIGEMNGMTVRRNDQPVHGKTSLIHHDGRGVFAGLPNPFPATRYHSLVVDRATIGADFEVSAWTERQEVMGLRWKATAGSAPMDGVQFHPESFLTVDGPRLLGSFLKQGAALSSRR